MKLLRYGPKGREKPGMLDDDGKIRDLSGKIDDITPAVIEKFEIGDSLGILPVHSCMTADCMAGYLSEEGEVIDHYQGTTK